MEAFYIIFIIYCVGNIIWGINELISQNPAVQERRANKRYERITREEEARENRS